MKKKHLTYAKKTLSVFLTVLMLMSAWVFVAPTEAEAASAVEYPLSVTVYNTTKLTNGGNIKVYYYEVKSDGTLGSTEIEHIFVSSLTRDKDANPTYTGTIPGFPVRIAVTVVNRTAATDKTSVRVIKIGEKTIFNDAYTVQDNQTINWKMGTSLGSWSPVGVWENPSWTASSTMSGTSVQVPAYGSRTVSWSTKASWKDQYEVTWPQSNVSYTFPATNGVTVSQSNGALTGVTATSAAISNITSGSTKNVTVTASGAGKTQTANITLNAPTKDVLYENLFSLSDWYYSDSSKWSDSNVVTDVNAGTVKITNPSSDSSSEYVTNATTGTHPSNYYSIPVKGGSSYYFTWKTANATSTEVFFMWKDSNGAGISYPSAYFSGNGTHWAEFTAPSNAESVELRFDNNTDGTTVTFSDIAVYEKTRADEIGIKNWTTRPVKKTYTYNASSAASAGLDQPVRTGYTFSGWQNSDGSAYTAQKMNQNRTVYSFWNINNYTANFEGNGGTPVKPSLAYTIADSITLPNATRDNYVFGSWKVTTAAGNWTDGATYAANAILTGMYGNPTLTAQWTKLHTVTFRNADGTVFTTVKVEDGKDATLPATNPTKASDATASYEFAGWEGNLQNVTEDRTVTPKFTATAHTFVWAANPYKNATCDAPALVGKSCSGCGYSLGNVPYDGDNVNWLAKGHDYSRGEILADSSTGNTDSDTHSIKCARYSTCGSTIKEAHIWSGNVSEGATCTTPGTIKKTCPCGAEKFVNGEIDDTNHVHTTLINVEAPDCENDGYTGDTYCEDCKKTVAKGTVDPKLGHSFTDYKSNGDATCTEDGTKTAKCDRCDATDEKTDEGSATGHTWKNEGTYLYSAADCENDAVYWQICDVCNISAEDDTTGIGDKWTDTGTKWNHNFTGDYVNNNNGTHDRECVNEDCTATGANEECTYGDWTKVDADTHSHTCEFCGYTPAAETHGWTAWKTVDGATNAAAAQHTRSCPDCKEVETEGCDYEVTDRPETCTAPQLYTYTCNECSHVYYENGKEATGHDYTGEAKSYNNGQHNFLCANGCNTYGVGETQGTRVGCDYDYDNTKTGEHQATCTECEYTFAEDCSGGQATCTAPATCDKCEKAYGDTAPHSFTGTPVQLDGDKHAYLCVYCSTEGLYGVGAVENDTEACSGGTATCTALAVCDVCKDTHGELDADAHKWGDWTNIDGTETHKRVCEYNTAHEEIGDCYSPNPQIIAPDCETAGYTLNTCDFCGHTWNTGRTEPLGHDWSDWANNEDGTHTRVCEDETCKYGENGEAKTETAACTKENAEAVVTDPDCLNGGYTTYTCKDCGYEWVDDSTPATGHSYAKQTKKTDVKYQRTTKDCTTDWTYWYCCDNCDVSAETEVDKYENLEELYWVREEAVGHKYDGKTATQDYLATPATCTAKATYYYSCSVCGTSSEDTEGAKTFESGIALGHNWEDTEKFKKSDSDCINNEVYYKECSRCHISSESVTDETWEKEDTKSGHDFDYEGGYTAGVAANCTEAGVKEHWTCETCGKHYADEEGTTEIAADKLVIAALKHDYKEIPAKAANCEEDGYTEHKQCQREDCGYRNIDYKVIPATGHDFKAENGYYCDEIYNYHAYKCTNCECYGVDGVKYSVDATGLDPEILGGIECTFTGEYVNYEDENGAHSHKLTCVCGNLQSAVCADKNGPDYTEPECGVNGYYTYVCTVCGYEWTVEDAGSALAHNYDGVAWTKVAGKDEHIRYCQNGCGESETEACYTENPLTGCGVQNVCDVCGGNFGSYTEHEWAEVEDASLLKAAATCTTNAVYYKKCSNCGEASTELTWTKANSKLGHAMSDYGYSIDGWKDANGNSLAPEGFDASIIKEPTCCTEGVQISYCSRCDVYKTKRVPADASKHQWEKDTEGNLLWVPVSGDCSTGITMTNRCTVEGCGKTQSKVEYDVEHTYEVVYVEYPTCKDEGVRIKKCVLCGETVTEHYNQETGLPADLKPTGEHTYEEISTTPATCTANAYKTLQCKVCKDTITEEIAGTMLEHAYIEYGEAAPSCETNGHSAYKKCTDCGVEEGKTVIEALGHTDADADGKCDECYRVLYETDDGEKSCGCICHKDNFLMKFIYKILNFFWKLFKISKSCDCGAVHW